MRLTSAQKKILDGFKCCTTISISKQASKVLHRQYVALADRGLLKVANANGSYTVFELEVKEAIAHDHT